MRDSSVDLGQQNPISILLLGTDTGSLGRTEQGRTDSMILATINPNTQKTTLVSIPRDTYAEIVGYSDNYPYYDKINSAYAYGGTEMAINTVQNLLGIPVDYYVTVNMAGVQTIVDKIGGIDVVSPMSFAYSDWNQDGSSTSYSFAEGPIHLDGANALAFSRMRHEDPQGDTGRQERQRLVIEAILKKLISAKTVFNYQNLLDALSTNVETNFQMADYKKLQSNNYVAALKNVQQEQLGGTNDTMDGIWYNFVDDSEIARVQTILESELEINQPTNQGSSTVESNVRKSDFPPTLVTGRAEY